jgi:hypothetical protein
VVYIQIKLQGSRRQMQHELTKDFIRGEKMVTDDRPKH